MARRWLLVALVAAAACDRQATVPSPKAPVTVVPTAAPDAEPAAVAEPPVVEGRVLTEGEIAMLRPIFGTSVDTSLVRVVPAKLVGFQADDTYMTPDNQIYAPGDLFEEDFSRTEIGPYLQAIFVHECTHVWQYQSGMDLVAAGAISFVRTKGDYAKAYPYTLERGRDLTEYGVEEQASIMEDWYLIQMYGLAPASYVDPPADAADRDDLYRAVLASFLADPMYARKLTPEELLRRHAEASGKEPVMPAEDRLLQFTTPR